MGKGGKERIVPFNRSTESALRAWFGDLEGFPLPGEKRGHSAVSRRARPKRLRVPVFLNYQGGRLSTRSVDRLTRKFPHGIFTSLRLY